ncbi:unnamed protein product [Peronospora belbahrii]|uniref:VPS9 domain-containing protein n=1 Tax=Peronospora belbahrii TaxID=622444 RepID=A0ABN8CTS1_9STRA|nr:unnamed protein product [Peronospora belbahrii]
MGEMFLHGLATDMEQTQRALPPHCLFCIPQPRSLLVDEMITQDVLYSHLLTPINIDDEPKRRLGEYRTFNGKQVVVVGSHVHTGKGFHDRRKVRILVSEKKAIQHQSVTVLHISRPLEGGINIPDDPCAIDIATFRKYTAILRSFPENELVFYQLNATINQVHKICAQDQVYERYKETLPAILREEWEIAVDELIQAGSFDDIDQDDRLQRIHEGGESHLLQLRQVVECYLMESLHDLVFPRVVASCQDQDKKLQHVMHRMRYYTPEDFGLRKEFQCFVSEARDTLLTIVEKKTPLDMLLVFKTCIDQISDAISRNVKLRQLDFEAYQLTTDDILDQLLFVLLQTFNQVTRRVMEVNACLASPFPIAAVIKYISDYHFINSNTTALGFTMANFQVAVEYFLMRGDHEDDCKDCLELALQDENAGTQCLQMIAESKCARAARKIRRDFRKSLANEELARRDTGTETGQEGTYSTSLGSTGDVVSIKSLSIVEFAMSDTNIRQVSGGQRFFASVMEDGALFTWGDSTGGRLGYALADGDLRRVNCPQRVVALEQQTITQVACGAFHTLATDLNGHVFAWGNNSKGQLGFLSPSASALFIAVETPSVVEDLRGVYMSSVACGEYHSLALSSDGCVFSWGCNKYGKLGRAAEGLLEMTQPSLIDADWTGWPTDTKSRRGSRVRSVVSRIAAGKDHSLAISSDGAGFSWGRGDSGQLGHGCYMDVSEPMQIMAISVAVRGTSSLTDVADTNKLFLSPTLLSLPSQLEREFFAQITAVSCGEMHYALLAKSGALLVSFKNFLQPSSDAGSTTAEVQERHITWVKEAGTVRQMLHRKMTKYVTWTHSRNTKD